jgi:cyclopropane fatty-acyl-phospholipid synthase-like methyltransferase
MGLTSEAGERFRDRYLISGSAALIEAELEVLGSDYSANGYTTMAEATALGSALGLDADSLLLDLGAGCGWPGLFLAKRHGCTVFSVDPIAEGMDVARSRATTDGLGEHHAQLCACGEALPFRSRAFDAVVHTDVVC